MGNKTGGWVKTHMETLGSMIEAGAQAKASCQTESCRRCVDLNLEGVANVLGRDATLIGRRGRCLACGGTALLMWAEGPNGFFGPVPEKWR